MLTFRLSTFRPFLEQAAVKAAIGDQFSQRKAKSSGTVASSDHHSPAKLHMMVHPRQSREDLEEVLGMDTHQKRRLSRMGSAVNGGPAIRLDLDDLGGEICLLDWGSGLPSASSKTSEFTPLPMMSSLVTLTSVRETRFIASPLVPLEDNPLVCPLPSNSPDPVGTDIKEIPQVLHRIQMDWRMGEGPNRASAWSLGRALCARLREKQAGNISTDAVDLVITGCEATWLSIMVKGFGFLGNPLGYECFKRMSCGWRC